MAKIRERKTQGQSQSIPLEVPADSDLSVRLKSISEQTGLSAQSLLQKWILQEETLIGLMRNKKEHVTEQAEKPLKQNAAKRKRAGTKTAPLDPSSPDYLRWALIERIKELQKEGMKFTKIAETLNNEKAPTLSGKGKWYASSITNILKPKAKK